MLEFNDACIGIYKDNKENQQNHLEWNIQVAYGNIRGIPLACLRRDYLYIGLYHRSLNIDIKMITCKRNAQEEWN